MVGVGHWVLGVEWWVLGVQGVTCDVAYECV